MVFNATFNNISVISCQSVLLVEENWIQWRNEKKGKKINNDLQKNQQHGINRTTMRTPVKIGVEPMCSRKVSDQASARQTTGDIRQTPYDGEIHMIIWRW
jgi:hypothetical protein